MKSRSRRLFIVLLHMVGISRNLPKIISSQFSWNVGLVGVNPQHIKANVIDISTIEGQSSPLWLMDNTDGKCLGPLGKFSECGDATLWTLRRRRRHSLLNGTIKPDGNHSSFQEETAMYFDYYSLEISDASIEDDLLLDTTSLVGYANPSSDSSGGTASYHQHHPDYFHSEKSPSECLTIAPTTNAASHRTEITFFPLKVGSCTSPNAWTWRIDLAGKLRHLPAREKMAAHGRIGPIKFLEISKAVFQHIIEFSIDILNPIGQQKKEKRQTFKKGDDHDELCVYRKISSTEAMLTSCRHIPNMQPYHLVTFSLVTRYHTHHHPPPKKMSSSSSATNVGTKSSSTKRYGLDTTTASLDALQMIASKHYLTTTSAASSSSSNIAVVPRHLDALQMIASRHYDTSSIIGKQPHHPSMVVRLHQNNGQQHLKTSINNNGNTRYKKIHEDATSSSISSAPRHDRNSPISIAAAVGTKQWKIPRHYYLETSSNEVWIDPQTHLAYRTDLCQYLGHTRKSSGRHTLAGVGQYTRTPLKIKVYGAAFYVSKRDVLSDPSFAPYAHLNAEQLRSSLEFYELLMSTETLVDRTLLVQLNMQMSTETIRSSLQASWTMLTEEMKNLLLNSSFKARQAESSMLAKISSPLNPSRCSCGQLAPESYQADPSCCSRGTELVFTWRKNGNLELRLDGRLIDTFPRPDMARGIFYEYLRADDPMSMDARNHFADGFPFLLAPLAQVRGITSATQPPQQQASETSWTTSILPAKVSSSKSFLSYGVGEVTQQVSKAMDGNVQGVLLGANQRKDTPLLRGGGTTFSNAGMETSPYDIVDENSVVQYPAMNFTHKLFSATVHIYLMLLLIVSLPGTGSTRVVSKRKGKNVNVSSCTGIETTFEPEATPQRPKTKVISLGSGKVLSSPGNIKC